MSDVMPRVILDELVALAVHHLGDGEAARALVDRVLAEHPDLAAAAVEAPSPAERLQAVDRLFGRVRWAVRERLPGVGRPAPAPARPPMPTPAPAGPPAPAAAPATAPGPTSAPAATTTAPPPAPVRPATPPWAPSRPAPQESPAPRAPVVPPAATIPQLEPPRTFIPPIMSGATAEPTDSLGPPLPEPDATPAAMPEVEESVSVAPPPVAPARSEPARSEAARSEPARSEPARSEPARSEPARAAPVPAAAPAADPPNAVPQLKLRPPPAPSAAGPVQAPRAAHDREPPPLQVEIVDDLYGIEAATRRRRRVFIGLAGLAVAAGAAWLVVLADLPQYFRGWEWPGTSSDTTTAEAPAEPDEMPPLETLELRSPDVAADQPNEAPADGTQLILRFDQAPEPAAGPDASPPAPGEEAARVFIHYDADAARASDAAAALYARLAEGSGYATVVLREVPYAIGSRRVRYYYADDRPAAEALVQKLGGPPGSDWQLQDFTFYRPLPVRGTLEVFVPTN